MKKYIVYVLIMFMFIVGTNKVNALPIEKTTRTTTVPKTSATTQAACAFNDRAEINNLAYAVTAGYEFVTDANGKVSFNLSVYNITGSIYVVIKSDVKRAEEVIIFPAQTRGGTYTWNVTDLNSIINYTITVRSTKPGCIGNYRTLTLTKPKKNKYYGSQACSYAGLEEFYYCTEWISQDFNLTEQQIEEKIKNELAKYTTSLKTRCISCEKEELLQRAMQAFQKQKTWIIRILIVLIVADIVAIITLLKRIKRYEL